MNNSGFTENYLKEIIDKIESINPSHADKIKESTGEIEQESIVKIERFIKKYAEYLKKNNKTLDYAIDCYMHMHDDMVEERINFIREGKYSNSSFADVEKKVYADPDIMTYHMHGLVLAQFLWYDQFQRFLFFSENLKTYAPHIKNYLEIGGGHGLYIHEAIQQFSTTVHFDLVDISKSSIELAKGILDNNDVNYINKNIFDFKSDDSTYDFITIGEVIEHLEKPLDMLKKIAELLSRDGICYLTTPVNAPMIDHIYLFTHEKEIRELVDSAGMEIVEEKIAISYNETESYARKHLIPIMFAAFIRRKK